VLILDESTAALDPVLENRVLNKLLWHRQDKITVIISHRPIGELRLVQAAAEGKIGQILFQANQTVQAGQAIAYIDDSRLQTKKRQLQDSIAQVEQQLRQNQTQQQALAQQIAAETAQSNRAVAAAQADLNLNQRTYQERQITTVAEFQEAEAALVLAREEFQRFRQLADTGAVAELQIREKEAAMQVAAARLKRMKAALNPSPAEVEKAREQIAQEQARGATAIARLNQERAQLSQQQKDLEIKLSNDRRELQQVETELQSTIIRAPISGIIQALTLRNRDQVVRVGDTIAQIAPSNADLVVKAWVPSQDIGKVAIGQPVQMRVSACPYPDYGTLSGVVQAISPDAIEQQEQPDSTALPPTAAAPKTAAYEITIQPNQRILRAKGKECPMQSGMNGQADIVSKEETLLLFIGRKARLLSSW
jgi:HlyD family secretion protein